MSIKLMTQLWDNKDKNLSGPRLLIMLCMAEHAGDDEKCWPSMDRISRRTRIDKRNVMRYIQELEQLGYLKIVREKGKHNLYVVGMTSGNFTTSGESTTSGNATTPTRGKSTTPTSGNATTPPVVILPPEPSLTVIEQQPLLEPSSTDDNASGAPRRKPAKPERDPAKDHPAVQAYRRITNLWPAGDWSKRIAESVTDMPLWEQIVDEWVGHGWNKRDVVKLLRAYKEGGIRDFKPSGNGRGKQTNEEIRDEVKRLRRERQAVIDSTCREVE